MTRNELSRVNKTNHHCVSIMKKVAHTEKRNKVHRERRGESVYVWDFYELLFFPPFLQLLHHFLSF